MVDHFSTPHGGNLVDLMISEDLKEEYKLSSQEWTDISLNNRQLNDLELLLNGGFSPLTGFMNKADYDAVCSEMRLADGTLWPIPITLDVNEDTAKKIKSGDFLALRDGEGVMLAKMVVEDVWQPDNKIEAESVYGTLSKDHSSVSGIIEFKDRWCVGGTIEGVQMPFHYDYWIYRQTPKELRKIFNRMGWMKIIAFQTRNPMHRAHFELTLRAANEHQANLLIHPAIGLTKPGDIDYFTRVRCYERVMSYYPNGSAVLSLLPLAMRMAGPREALWHAIIRKNYGATHFIVGRDHASPGSDSKGNAFYDPYAAQELLRKHEEEINVKMVPFKQLVYLPERDEFEALDNIDENTRTLSISGTELRARLHDGREIPSWFTFPEVSEELRKTYPPRSKQGFTVFFTGLSGSGKSTIANALVVKLLQVGGRPVTLLDGDIVRKNLSSELGFSKDHRNINILRIGYVASEITKNGGVAVCAPIAPYNNIRQEVRQNIEGQGGFVLVHVATPLEVCEQRDRKGLYAKARAGIVKEFTGISDPYEIPRDADLEIDTSNITPVEAVQMVLLYLKSKGFIDSAKLD